MPLTTLANLKSYLRVTDSTKDTYYNLLLASATSSIESFCGRSFAKQTGIVEYKTTNGTRSLILRKTPVWTITSIHLDFFGYFNASGSAFASDSLLTAGTDYALDINGLDGLSYSGLVYRITGVWPERSQVHIAGLLTNEVVPAYGNVKAVYTGGYDPIPDDLQNACVQVASVMDLMLKGAPRVSERLGNGSYTRDFSLINGAGFCNNPIIGSVRQVLSRYRELPW